MSHRHTTPVESICTVLSCTPEEFWDVYENTTLSTSVLSEDALANTIAESRTLLLSVKQRHRLDDFLSGMLEYAPHPLGKRYVAVALHIASKKGGDTVVDLAKAWMEQMFLPSQPASESITVFHSLNPCVQYWPSQKPLSPNSNPAVARPAPSTSQRSTSKPPVHRDRAVSEPQ